MHNARWITHLPIIALAALMLLGAGPCGGDDPQPGADSGSADSGSADGAAKTDGGSSTCAGNSKSC